MITRKHIPNFFSIAINSSSVKFLTSVVVVFLFSDCKKTPHKQLLHVHCLRETFLNIFCMMLADKYMLMNYRKQLVMHIRVVENNLLDCHEWIFNYMYKSKHC